MPRGALPPTPASSTDIQGQDGLKQLASLQTAFELPPPAISSSASDTNMPSPPHASPETTKRSASAKRSADSTTSPTSSSKSPYTVRAAEAVKSRRRSSAQAQAQAPAQTQTNDHAAVGKDFALPPPPMRSRKIIQVKPRTTAASAAGTVQAGDAETTETPVPAPTVKYKGSAASASTAAAAAQSSAVVASPESASKKKQSSATSAAGRKIARKTAHSLIERRRRSKMNEEFSVLKDMIPACKGEMHKLAILQASIEYIRYLEDCMSTLKSQQETGTCPSLSPREMPQYTDAEMAEDQDDDEEDDDEDEASAALHAQDHHQQYYARHRQPDLPQDARHNSSSSSGSEERRHHYGSFSYHPGTGLGLGGFTTFTTSAQTSAQTSPAFGPQRHPLPLLPGSTLTSPALVPQRDLDHEATAALLMLNSDRRGMHGSFTNPTASNNIAASGRGMSVQDLLST